MGTTVYARREVFGSRQPRKSSDSQSSVSKSVGRVTSPTSLREALTKEERRVFSLMGSTVWSLSGVPGRRGSAARAEGWSGIDDGGRAEGHSRGRHALMPALSAPTTSC